MTVHVCSPPQKNLTRLRWAVIGRWESSPVDSKEFYRPIVTPFELELALQTGSVMVWDGKVER
jgi:hypothetical protein